MTDRLAGQDFTPGVAPQDAADNGESSQHQQRHEPPGQPIALRWQTYLDNGDTVSVLVRRSAINVLLNNEQPSYTFDPLGRLHGAFIDGVNYRRSLDNRVLSKWAEHSAGTRARRRRWLTPAEARAWVEAAQRLVQRLQSQAASAPPLVQDALNRLWQWDWAALEADRQRFEQIYTPVGILPPDQYLALVLQATHGCSHNACTFCTFYRDVRFRIKTPDEFRRHVAAVLDFFGPAIRMRRSIFLADANALVIPMPRLLALLEVLSESQSDRVPESQSDRVPESQSDRVPESQSDRVPESQSDRVVEAGGRRSEAGGRRLEAARVDAEAMDINASLHGAPLSVPSEADQPWPSAPLFSDPLTSDPLTSDLLALPLFAFIDAFHVERKSLADWQELAARGLRRVYIGMESGHDPLLRWLNKPGDAADVLEAVTTLKAAGVQVSVIIMLGVGGERFAAGHVADTIKLLNAMPLGQGDLIYFSDFVDQPGAPYAELAAKAGIAPLDSRAMRSQEASVRAGFVPRDPRRPPQFSRYDIDEFIY